MTDSNIPESSSEPPAGGSALGRLQANVARIHQRIRQACDRARRDPASVRLVVVTKTVGPDIVSLLPDCGVTCVGENRLQVALPKIEAAPPGLQWHFVGHLQRNKARKVARLFDAIHSIDSIGLARHLSAAAREAGRRLEAFVQVNVAGEERKHGISPAEAPALIDAVLPLEGLELTGLMTIAPLGGDIDEARRVFRALRQLRDSLPAFRTAGGAQRSPAGPTQSPGAALGPIGAGGAARLRELSMGMTDDFEAAIEEGATVVRIGRAALDGLA